MSPGTALANLVMLPDNRAVSMCGLVRRLAAVVALFGVLGWLGLPAEHIHTSIEQGRAVEHVHRHLAVHGSEHLADHDHAQVDHDEDAVYVSGQAVELARPEMPGPQSLAAWAPRVVAPPLPVRSWTVPPLAVHVHAPPWGRLYARRGPPAFAV